RAAGELLDAGAGAVVVSLGGDGLLAVTGDGTWHAAPPGQVAGNPTGAGDAVVAGLAQGLVLGRPWAGRLRHAAALGTAAGAAATGGAPGPRGGGGAGRGAVGWGGLGGGAGRARGPPRGGGLIPAAGMAGIVGPASAAGRGVGAFNIIGIEHAEAVIAGAEAA